MSRINVLKLGWEFPPLINGGLGVACHGLAEALSKKVNLHVVVPKADLSATYDGFSVSSLDQSKRVSSTSKTTLHKQTYKRFAHITEIDEVDLDPYYSDEKGYIFKDGVLISESEAYHYSTSEDTIEVVRPRFTIDKLYGDDVGQKVHEFSEALKFAAMQYDFDVIHAHDWMTYQAGVALKHATGKPLVVHLHASQYDRAGADARGWIYDIERYGMQEADRVIPVSNYTAGIVRDHYHIPEQKIRTVHNGAEGVASFKTVKKFPETLVLFLGRLTAQKGPEFFLEIAASVLAENPNVRFVMAGTGEKMRSLMEAGAFKGLGGRFHFTGFLNKQKVNDLLSMTDIYCMPSVSEPFGLSALEAAQFGIPAVISKQSGVAEILKGALTADFWDTQLMAQHINDLINDPELRERVVKSARADIESSTWDSAAEKVVEIYEELL